jgi:outer membrane lipoprotein-sorting protein
MAGTVEIDNNLGLPAIPGLPSQLAGGTSQIRVWTDGTGRTRLSIPAPNSEETLVNDGTTLYDWNSTTHTVTEHHLGGHATTKAPAGASNSDLNPATAAKAVVAAVQQVSTVSVDGTDMVANRPAYDLVLTPKANQRTLLRQVRIAVDAQTRVPLRLTVLANNTDTPAIQVGFSSLNVGAQDPSLFRFTAPAGATVTNGDKTDQQSATKAGEVAPTIVGKGWETVVVAQVPTSATGQSGAADKGSSMLGLVRQFGKPVSGSWGSGWLISTNVGEALITSDGRIAAGFVPQQVLTKALGSTK